MTLSVDVLDSLAANPKWLLDDLKVRDLRTVSSPRQAFERAGFTVHYWRPAAPASMFGNVEMLVEHADTGLWLAACVEMREQRESSDALANLENALAAATVARPASPSLAALTQSVATAASRSLVRVGEVWAVGGLLLGCLRVVEQTSPHDLHATRMLVALTDPDLIGQLDRLAQWQQHADTDRVGLSEVAERAYVRATASLWPRLARVAETVAKDIKTDRLLSYPREEWDRRAVEIVLDAVANQQTYVLRPLQAAWEGNRLQPDGQPTGEKFSAERLIEAAVVPEGIAVPTLR